MAEVAGWSELSAMDLPHEVGPVVRGWLPGIRSQMPPPTWMQPHDGQWAKLLLGAKLTARRAVPRLLLLSLQKLRRTVALARAAEKRLHSHPATARDRRNCRASILISSLPPSVMFSDLPIGTSICIVV